MEPGYQTDRPEEHDEGLDEIVENLLRDKDFLLSREIKHRVEELNRLFVQAERQKLKVELETAELESRPGKRVSWIDVRVFKEI